MCVWSFERGVSGLGEEKAQGGPKFGQYRPSAWFFHGTEQPRVTTSSQVPPLPHRVTDGFSLSPMLYQSTFPTSMQCVFFSFLLYDDALHISHVATTRRFQNLELMCTSVILFYFIDFFLSLLLNVGHSLFYLNLISLVCKVTII